jgi:SMI1-KNR4 cell-wall
VAERIEWQCAAADPLPENVLRGAELLFGVTFPADYRACVRVNHGAHPQPRDFTVRGTTTTWGSCPAVLLSLDWRRPDNVWSVLAGLAVDGPPPDGLFPIAADGGGDLLCLDFRAGPAAPPVVYWSHEVGGADGVAPVAESFTELLSLLR